MAKGRVIAIVLDEAEKRELRALTAQARNAAPCAASVAELEKAIHAYIAATNADPKPFRWTKGRRHPRQH